MQISELELWKDKGKVSSKLAWEGDQCSCQEGDKALNMDQCFVEH